MSATAALEATMISSSGGGGSKSSRMSSARRSSRRSRKRTVSKQELSFISRSLSCLFTAQDTTSNTTSRGRSSSSTGTAITAAGESTAEDHGILSHSGRQQDTTTTTSDYAVGPPRKRRNSSGTLATAATDSPSLCSLSSFTSCATNATGTSPPAPLPTTISMKRSRSIGKLSQTDSLSSLVGAIAPSCFSASFSNTTTASGGAIGCSDCSIRTSSSDLDSSFHSRARQFPRRDSCFVDDDSLSYSDDSSGYAEDDFEDDQDGDENCWGWYDSSTTTNITTTADANSVGELMAEDEEDSDEGGIFF